jgi:hypothetical protein
MTGRTIHGSPVDRFGTGALGLHAPSGRVQIFRQYATRGQTEIRSQPVEQMVGGGIAERRWLA